MKTDRRTLLAGLLGAPIVFAHFLPRGLLPIALADDSTAAIPGKDGLTVLNDRPLNAETPPHLLNDDITPTARMFVRNNGRPPEAPDPENWVLSISGESVINPREYSIADLRSKFEPIDLQLLVECGGNGRYEFFPPATGNQWTLGAVGCPVWNGIRLRDVLKECGIADDAVYIGYRGADQHLSGDPDKAPISRGVPIAKAMEAESMIAWGMNGQDLHPMNGYPLRLAIGGWPGSVSGKWLTEILVRDRIHDGEKMGGQSYRVPCEPVAPGTEVPDEDMCIIESMPVKSLVTAPRSGVRHEQGRTLAVHGHAWAGDHAVQKVEWSIDFGQTWKECELAAPVNRLAWQNWDADISFPEPGYYEVWARATDASGISQPMLLPGWNPKGYLNNAAHRVAVYVV